MLDIIKMMVLALLVSPAIAKGVDPTEPPSWSAPKVAQSQASGSLESIMINGKQRLAIIGGKAYREGDRWGQKRIKAIRRDQVVLSDGTSLRVFPQVSELSQER